MAYDGSINIDTRIDEKGFSKLGSIGKTGLKVLGGMIAAAGAGLASFGGVALQTASDLTEVQNVVDSVFGESSQAVNDFAKTADEAFGLSELQAKKYTGTLGAMFSAMGVGEDATRDMSIELAGLAGDLASFYNLEPDEAFDKLRSAISGEVEPMKALGVVMSQTNLEAYALSEGFNKSYSEMTAAEQATVRYGFIMNATAKAQGDWGKTLEGSFSNQVKYAKLQIQDLAGAVGKDLLPAGIEGMKLINDMLSNMQTAYAEGGAVGLISAVGDALGTIVTKIAEYAPIIVQGAVGLIQQLINSLIENMPAFAEGLVSAAESLVSGILEMFPTLLLLGMSIITQLIYGIAQAIPSLMTQIVNVVMQIITTFTQNIGLLIQVGIVLLKSIVQGLITAIPLLIEQIPVIIDMLIAVIMDNLSLIIEQGFNILVALIDGILSALPKILEMLPAIITKIIECLIANLPLIAQFAPKIIITLITGIIGAIPTLIKNIPKIVTAVVNGLGKLIPEMLQMGKDILIGLWNGLKAKKDWIVGKVKELLGNVKDAIKNFFGIASPSKVFRDEIGANLALGIGVGFDKEYAAIAKGIKTRLVVEQNDLARRTTDMPINPKPQIPEPKNNGSGQILITGNTFYVRSDNDVKGIARELQILAEKGAR